MKSHRQQNGSTTMNRALTIFIGTCAICASVGVVSEIVFAETVTRTIELDGVNTVKVHGNYNVVVTLGDEEYVRLTADENDLEEIEARIKGKILNLGKENNSWGWWGNETSNPDASFEVQVRELVEVSNLGSGIVELVSVDTDEDFKLSNYGSGELNAKDIAGNEVTVRNYGSGTLSALSVSGEEVSFQVYGSGDSKIDSITAKDTGIKLYGSGRATVNKGKTETLEANTYGSGDISAKDLIANKADISIYGSGEIAIYVVEELEASIYGSGDVSYYGPVTEIDESSHGSGDVRKAR